MKFPLPDPLWVAETAGAFSAGISPEGHQCCLLFSSEDFARSLAASRVELVDAHFRSMGNDDLKSFLAVVKTRGITHVIIDHESAVPEGFMHSITFEIDDLIASLGESPRNN